MDFSALFKQAGKAAAENSPAILTAIGVTGTLTTAYLAAKAAFKSVDVLREAEEAKEAEFQGECAADPVDEADPADVIIKQMDSEGLTTQEKVEAVWQLYVPAAVSAAMTVAAIICSNRISDRRAAALASAYAFAEKSYGEYRAKNVQKVGKKKEQEVRDEVAQDRVTNNPPSQSTIVLINEGTVLCHDAYSDRYFLGSMDILRKAENDMNWEILNDDYASLSDFYHMVGLRSTSSSDDLGWTVADGQKFKLDVTTTTSEDERPCFTFTFQSPPVPKYYRNTH